MFIGVVITGVAPLLSLLYAGVDPHAVYFEKHLQTVISKLEEKDFKGPIGPIMAQRALARQVLEDSLSKKPESSCAGISKGGFNSAIANEVLRDYNLSIGSARDSAGDGPFLYLKGPQANIASTIIIAKLFDFYVGKFMNKENKKAWFMAKETSKGIHLNPDSFELNHKFHCILQPDKIVKKSCSIFGPGATDQIIKRSVKNGIMQKD
jgi:hypothetical protein